MMMAGQIQPRPIKRILIANRGEIATRLISSCRELSLETVALYTPKDISHILNSTLAVSLDSPSAYTSVETLVRIARENHVDAVHPGYGFLSESPELAARMAEVDVLVVGPGPENLARTGDKLSARKLAESCDVPVLPALTTPTGDVQEVERFVTETKGLSLPVMVKAVDGGGGRGIRLIRRREDLRAMTKRAMEESPSKKVFVEKAAVDGFRHVEVQILGDGRGNVRHLWERECSVQRRYQKIVEVAPSTVEDRRVVGRVIEAAVRMAKRINYSSLGTFEFLLNPQTQEYYFLEINPRLQVEHTITESICSIDIVQTQLRLAQGATFEEVGLSTLSQDPLSPPQQYSIQLRLTAEDPERNHSLSIGKIQSFHFPTGAGTRVDTALIPGHPSIITSDFDSLIAKIILTAPTWADVVRKASRALEDTWIHGIKTNLPLLRAIISHQDFQSKNCSTQWLETHHQTLLQSIRRLPSSDPFHNLLPLHPPSLSSPPSAPPSSSSPLLLQKNDAWTLSLSSPSSPSSAVHHLLISKILQSSLPQSLSAEILYTTPSSSSPQPYNLVLTSTSASGSAATSNRRKGDPSNPNHVVLPLSGKLVEMLVEVGDELGENEGVCVVGQMKMEVEVRTKDDMGGQRGRGKRKRVSWVMEVGEGEEVGEGWLVAELEDLDEEEEGKGEGRAKL